MGVDDEICETRLGLGFGSSWASLSPSVRLLENNRKVDVWSNESGGTSCVSKASVKRERAWDDGSNRRKKLRLTKPQSALLEESFKRHTTLSPKQKQELATELKLRPRQVEVWFQNRRARTKLKQTEVECELLKKWCETLSNENRRLHKELQALKLAPAAARLTMCPTSQSSKTTFAKQHFYNPSAAC